MRPIPLIWLYWSEVLMIEERAARLPPIYWEVA